MFVLVALKLTSFHVFYLLFFRMPIISNSIKEYFDKPTYMSLTIHKLFIALVLIDESISALV